MRYVICLIIGFSLNVFAIPNDHDVNNNIKRGGRPSRVDLDNLKKQGFKTIINIEDKAVVIEKEKKYATQLGFNYMVSEINTHAIPDDQQIDEILSVLNDKNSYPIFIHCMHGRDRTGMVVGLHRVLNENWSQAEAYNEMLALGFRPQFVRLKQYFFEKTKGH